MIESPKRMTAFVANSSTRSEINPTRTRVGIIDKKN